MDKKEAITYIQKGLEKYGAKIYNYQGTEFIGIENKNSENHIAITFNDDMAMEFTYQTAHFAYGDEDDLIMHAEKYLQDRLVAVEIFYNGKNLFGGSREPKENIEGVEELADWYAGGNGDVAKNLLTFFKNGNVLIKIFSFGGKHTKTYEITSADGDVSLSLK